MSHAPAGWYDDGAGQQRYWDGQQWLNHAQPEAVPALPDAALVHGDASPVEPHGSPVIITGQNPVQDNRGEPIGAVEAGGVAGERDAVRRLGILGGGVALFAIIACQFATLPPIPVLVVAVVTFLALIFLITHRRGPAIAMWLIVLGPHLYAGLAILELNGESWFSVSAGVWVVASAGYVFALVGAFRINPLVVAGEKAQRAQQAAHDRRVAEIRNWEAAYRDAHGGQSPPPGFMPPVAQTGMFGQQSTNIMAVLALVFGIGGGLLGVVFGHIALSQIKRTGERGRGMAIWGLTLGYLGLAGIVIYFVVIVAILNS